jgi:putative ATPase
VLLKIVSWFMSMNAPSTQIPLAERMRPANLEEMIGQEQLLGPDSALVKALRSGRLFSVIFWGPPGSGKTTLARLLAQYTQNPFETFSAVTAGVKDLREVVARAEIFRKESGKPTILFVDEIHRFNKAQQDAFLPHVESGLIILVGATTQNPSFEVIPPLLSRARVMVLRPLEKEDLKKILTRALPNRRASRAGRPGSPDPNLRRRCARGAQQSGTGRGL